MENLGIVVLVNGTVLISMLEQVSSELGEPDCQLIKPMVVDKDSEGNQVLTKWLSDFTNEEESIMMSSDKILTIVSAKQSLIDEYLKLTT